MKKRKRKGIRREKEREREGKDEKGLLHQKEMEIKAFVVKQS